MRKNLKDCITFVLASIVVIIGLLAGGFGNVNAKAETKTIGDILPEDFPVLWEGVNLWAHEDDIHKIIGYLDQEKNKIHYFTNEWGGCIDIDVTNELSGTSPNYTYSQEGIYFTFIMEDDKLVRINTVGDSQQPDHNGNYIKYPTIAGILPDDFPRSSSEDVIPENAWVNEKGAAIFATDYALFAKSVSKNYGFSLEYSLTYDADNKVYEWEGTSSSTLSFYMDSDDSLCKITSNDDPYYGDINGTYLPSKAINEILPDDFPSTVTDAWANENGKKVYYDGTNKKFVFDDFEIPVLCGLGKDDNSDYILKSRVTDQAGKPATVTLKFQMTDGILSNINFATGRPTQLFTADYTGDYKLVPKYTITNAAKSDDESANHGYIIIDKERAAQNETVTVTVYPSENYRLKSTPKYVLSGETYYGSKGANDNEYTFRMPDSDITITAEFEYVTVPPTPTPTSAPTPKPVDPTKEFSDVPAGKWYSKPDGPIAYVVANGIMKGTGNGSSFEPESPCTREMFVQILYNAEGAPGAGPSNPFTDVKAGKWYYNAVTWALANNVTSGKSATEFGVGENVTREQLAQFLMNYATKRGFDTTKRADLSKFPDAGEVSGWAKNAISWANANGIINGKAIKGTNYLAPKGNATRAETAQMIMAFMKEFEA